MAKETGYCIKGPDGDLHIYSIRDSEGECQEEFANTYAVSWNYMKKQGYTCVQVNIEEIEE